MIVHVFSAVNKILSLDLAQGFLFYFRQINQKIILVAKEETDTSEFVRMFEKEGYTNFIIIRKTSEFRKEIIKHQKDPILLHGENYWRFLTVFLSGCNNVNWVCWGSGASIRNNWKSEISALFKTFIYKKFNSIVTLIDGDKNSIINDFKLSQEKVVTIPYMLFSSKRREEVSLGLLNHTTMVGTKSKNPVILLGNNPCNIDYYIQLMELLSPFKGAIEVHCMMNYSLLKDAHYYYFMEVGRNTFGNDFYSDEDFYEGDAYMVYMNKCDVYICGNPLQTGLGAIEACLLLGKKMFLTGKNYEWIKEYYQAKVYNISEITTYDSLVTPLEQEYLSNNRNVIIDSWQKSRELWINYLERIQQK
jgi:hypothetical protein